MGRLGSCDHRVRLGPRGRFQLRERGRVTGGAPSFRPHMREGGGVEGRFRDLGFRGCFLEAKRGHRETSASGTPGT